MANKKESRDKQGLATKTQRSKVFGGERLSHRSVVVEKANHWNVAGKDHTKKADKEVRGQNLV